MDRTSGLPEGDGVDADERAADRAGTAGGAVASGVVSAPSTTAIAAQARSLAGEQDMGDSRHVG
ncbi:hypothetical protein ACFWIJ_35360 [Streptomyces sp. NPDC127079]|uniref:hypothetical protein n=1 Tax=Streptomyces sp. NPDC127079 TaxID=3347132 RepID=UPI00365225D8